MTDQQLRADIARAKSLMETTFGAKRELRTLTQHLWQGEVVERIGSGTYGGGTGIIVVTDRRMLFFRDGMISKTSEDFQYDKISSIQWSSGILLGTITVFASGNKAEIKNVGKQDGKSITDIVRNRISNQTGSVRHPATGQQQMPPPPSSGPSDSDLILDRLKKLGELHAAGVVTDEEFNAKKSELLDRL